MSATRIRVCAGEWSRLGSTRVLLVAENERSGGVGRYCVDVAALFAGESSVLCLCPRYCDGTSDCWLSRACDQRGVPLLSVDMPPRGWTAGFKGLRDVWKSLGRPVVHTNGRRGNFAACVARLTQRRFGFVSTVHGVLGLHDRRNVAYRVVDLAACRFAGAVIAVSADTRRRLIQSGVSAKKIACILNGLADKDLELLLEVAAKRRMAAERGGRTRVGFLGRLSPEKGIDDFLQLASKLDADGLELSWAVAGSGPDEEAIREKAAELTAAGRLEFMGEISDVPAFLATTDILAMPSANEGLPYSLLEAMAAGCAVVAYGVGGVTEVLSDSSLGRSVQPGDRSALRAAVAELAAQPEVMADIGRAGSAHVAAHFALSGRKAALQTLYSQAAARRRRKESAS